MFEQAAVNKPSFRVFTLSQQPANLPLTLTTDAPEYFQLAADGSPRFLPELTLTPLVSNTYVHVRFLTTEAGQHVGQLSITNGQETIEVELVGQRRRRSMVRLFRPLANEQSSARLTHSVKPVLLLLSIALLAAVGYAVFSNRLFQRHAVSKPAVSVSSPVPKTEPVSSAEVDTPPKKERTAKRVSKPKVEEIEAPELKPPKTAPLAEQPLSSEESATTERQEVVAEPKKAATPRNSEPTSKSEQSLKKASSATQPAPLSELERALNQP